MYDAFGIYYDEDENLGLLAAGSRWTSGGNSKAARRARVAMQRRDRFGRWAEMGGGIAFPGRNSDGKIVKMVGRYVGPAEREGYMRVYVTESRGIRAGIYEVPCKVATVAKALGYETILDGKNLSQKSIQDAALLILKGAGTLEDILSNVPVVSKLGFLISTIIQFAGTVAFIIGYVAAKIISGREITGAADCSPKRRK